MTKNKNEDRAFVIMQYCLDKNTVVRRTKECLNVCDNPKCKSCEPWREAWEEMSREFLELEEELKNNQEVKKYIKKNKWKTKKKKNAIQKSTSSKK